jgi:hypothetical protein
MVESNQNLKTIIADTPLVKDESTESVCGAAFRNPNVTALHYTIKGISVHASMRIPQWVANAPNIETLVFKHNSPPSVKIQAIIHSCRSLKALHFLQGNYPDRTIQALETYLRSSSTLKELKIASFGMIHQAKTIRSLGEVLGNNVLEKLSLRNTECRSGRIGSLGVVLSVNTSLTELDFSDCSLGDDDVVALCQGLAHNKTLQSLQLYSNYFGDKGVTAVATLIASNDQLVEISIRNHHGGDKSVAQIGHALKHNTSLRSLDVCPASPTSFRALLDGVKEHPTLTTVHVPYRINSMQRHELWYYLKLNGGARHSLNAPLDHWPLLLHGADRCRPLGLLEWADSPSMLYYFVKEKCDLFNDSTRRVDGSPGMKEETATPGRKRGRGNPKSGPSKKGRRR